jgi:hypothetical protein
MIHESLRPVYDRLRPSLVATGRSPIRCGGSPRPRRRRPACRAEYEFLPVWSISELKALLDSWWCDLCCLASLALTPHGHSPGNRESRRSGLGRVEYESPATVASSHRRITFSRPCLAWSRFRLPIKILPPSLSPLPGLHVCTRSSRPGRS